MRIILLFTVCFCFPAFAQVTGLADWSLFIDPGHSQKENMGIYNYSEAEKVLRIGLYLQHLLETKTDIDQTYMSRTNDNQQVSLSQRTDAANAVGADWYHSIHSNAGTAESNSTLLLWGQYNTGQEKIPHGGHAMSDIMIDIYTRAMRTYTVRGSVGDCSFYGCGDWLGPWLHVNRETNMPSELSEGGYHTNPVQNQLNMNADWKKIEAYAIFWSILKFFKLERPPVDIATGIIRDIETGKPINGARITIGDTSYVTDTYESLFYKYSSNPNQLANGFYFLDNLSGDSITIKVEADGYFTQQRRLALIDTFFTYADFDLLSSIPPHITSTQPVNGDSAVLNFNNIVINFSRSMDRKSVEQNFSIEPNVYGYFSWQNNGKKLIFTSKEIEFETNYIITIDSGATDSYDQVLDGNGDGTGGDPFVLSFITGRDEVPPQITKAYPQSGKINVENRPLINFEYDEWIDSLSISENPISLMEQASLEPVQGQSEYYYSDNRTVLNFFPGQNLKPLTKYALTIQSGLKDHFDNSVPNTITSIFTTDNNEQEITTIEDFNGDFMEYWWAPQQNENTTGIENETNAVADSQSYNLLYTDGHSMKLNYDWNLAANSWLIREYLSGGDARDVEFDQTKTLQVYILGDGSNTKFRFAIDEDNNDNWANYEVSKWFTINWIGWRLVEWDLSNPNTVGDWTGNGKLDGVRYRFDSFQLTYDGSFQKGVLYFDDLQVVQKIAITALNKNASQNPINYNLAPNYPNPFNPETHINYSIARAGWVKMDVFNMLGQKVKTLVNKIQKSGTYEIVFQAGNLSSGNYTVRLEINGKVLTRKITLVK